MSALPDHDLSTQAVTWLYRCILGREPESDEVISSHIRSHGNFESARQFFLKCDEFAELNKAQSPQVYIPEDGPSIISKSEHRLCLVSIVRDESAFIADMLRSCRPIVDFAAIVDTGSTDNTVEVAEQTLLSLGIPYVVERTTFVDFAQARNSALSRVPDSADWILVMDADEELVVEDYNKFKDLLDSPDAEGWKLPRFNFLDSAKRRPVMHYPDYQMRLFRNRPERPVRYAGRVHEQPVDVEWRLAPAADIEQGLAGGPHIHHFGLMKISQERWQKKHDLYTSLGAYDGNR